MRLIALGAALVIASFGALVAPDTDVAQKDGHTSAYCDRSYERRVKNIRDHYADPIVRSQMEAYALEDYDACLRSAEDRSVLRRLLPTGVVEAAQRQVIGCDSQYQEEAGEAGDYLAEGWIDQAYYDWLMDGAGQRWGDCKNKEAGVLQ